MVNIFRDYCSNSTIHGLQYLGEIGRPFWERIFWIFVIIASIYACSDLIYKTWRKWNDTPVIVSFSEKSKSVWEIPFPAVTICPETKTQQRVFNFTEMYWAIMEATGTNGTFTRPEEMSLEEFDRMKALLQVCEAYLIEETRFEPFQIRADIVELLGKIAPTFNQIYPFCKWKNVLSSCEPLFSKIITEEGICHTFNGLNASELYREGTINYNFIWEQQKRTELEWDLQNGYKQQAGARPYPERVISAGARAGLFVVLQGFDYNMDYLCRGPVQGFKVLLHSPDEVPQVTKQYFRVPFNKEIIVSVKPNMIVTSESLFGYPPHRRQCFFSEERYLRYFQVYTQSNCQLECLANYTLERCGCVKFSMPRALNTSVCDISLRSCYEDAEDSLLRREFVQSLKGSAENKHGGTKCDCLPACTSLEYNAEVSQAHFHLTEALNAYHDSYEIDNPGVKIARLSIFFKENQFITSKRSELFGMTDFLASCGGLFGLFMGVSAFSVVEFFFFTLRLLFNVRTNNS